MLFVIFYLLFLNLLLRLISILTLFFELMPSAAAVNPRFSSSVSESSLSTSHTQVCSCEACLLLFPVNLLFLEKRLAHQVGSLCDVALGLAVFFSYNNLLHRLEFKTKMSLVCRSELKSMLVFWSSRLWNKACFPWKNQTHNPCNPPSYSLYDFCAFIWWQSALIWTESTCFCTSILSIVPRKEMEIVTKPLNQQQ